MPTELDNALSLLFGHALCNGQNVINTKRLDKEHKLNQKQHLFNGISVANILIFDNKTTFVQTRESRAIVSAMLAHMERIHGGAISGQCDGIIRGEDIQNVIDTALFELEKAYIREAKPEVFKTAPIPIEQKTYFDNLSPTSALVLKWAGIDVFQTDDYEIPKTKEYMRELAPKIDKSYDTLANNPKWKSLKPESLENARQIHKYRKAHFFAEAEKAIAQGHTQIVLVANGYNPMAVSLAEKYPHVTIYCTDSDLSVVTDCRQMYEKLGLSNIKYVHHNLNNDEIIVNELHTKAGLHAKEPIYAQMEGISYYVDAQTQARVIKDLLGDPRKFAPKNAVLIDFADEYVVANSTHPRNLMYREIGNAIGSVYNKAPYYNDPFAYASLAERYDNLDLHLPNFYHVIDPQINMHLLDDVKPGDLPFIIAKLTS